VCGADSGFLQATLQAQYPALVRLWGGLVIRLQTIATGTAAAGAVGAEDDAVPEQIEYGAPPPVHEGETGPGWLTWSASVLPRLGAHGAWATGG
jgi:hypothetical protein